VRPPREAHSFSACGPKTKWAVSTSQAPALKFYVSSSSSKANRGFFFRRLECHVSMEGPRGGGSAPPVAEAAAPPCHVESSASSSCHYVKKIDLYMSEVCQASASALGWSK
jgi:hypothetical protein